MSNIFASAASDLGRTVAEAKPLLMKLNNADTSKRPMPGKWSKKEILGHLLDSASNNHQRFVRATLDGKLVFPGYEQDRLVDLQQFREMDWGFVVDFWASYNRFLAHVLTCLPNKAAKVTCVIGKSKPASLGWIAEDYVAHLKHHLNQILGHTFETTYGSKSTTETRRHGDTEKSKGGTAKSRTRSKTKSKTKNDRGRGGTAGFTKY